MGRGTIIENLKDVGLPSYGTAAEKRNRLRNHFGLGNQSKNPAQKGNILADLERLDHKKQEKRQKFRADSRSKRENARKMRAGDGHNGYESYQTMLNKDWLNDNQAEEHKKSDNMRINICVRKRPMFDKENKDGHFDCISSCNPVMRIHEPKTKVDGITKYIDTTDFKFDNVSTTS